MPTTMFADLPGVVAVVHPDVIDELRIHPSRSPLYASDV
jgi:hypothetical protein